MKAESPLRAFSYLLGRYRRADKGLFVWAAVSLPFRVLDRLADVYLLALLVGAAERGDARGLLFVLGGFALYRLLSGVCTAYAEKQLAVRGWRFRMRCVSRFCESCMTADLCLLESPDGQDLAQRASNTMAGADYRVKPPVEAVLPLCVSLLGSICGLTVYSGLLAVADPLLLVLLAAVSGVNYALQRILVRYDQKDKLRYIPLDRRLWYLIRELREPERAKEIRLYGMTGWLKRRFDETLGARMKLHVRRSRLQFACVAVVNLLDACFTAFVYFFLIRQVLAGEMDVSAFLLYFGLITGFNGWLLSFADGLEGLHGTLLQIEDLRAFEAQTSPRAPEQPSDAEESTGADDEIVFENVSFGYADGEDVLHGVSFRVKKGEKIAVVGRNGAGKSTLVKLLCGLYLPREGRILVGGRDTRTVSQAELALRFAAVFQEIRLLPTTVERNITLTADPDPARLAEALSLSGFAEVADRLPDGTRTLLVKEAADGGIDLSGGQVQKLALARALYRGGDVLVLDEPTAALDPLAERELYFRYGELTAGKTALFISHRLSSTHFCDRVLYFEKGRLTESGTHEKLLADGGAYANLYEVQSRAYRTEQEGTA